MEKLRLVEPTIEYKDRAIDYIEEHLKYNSPINGVGGLHRYLDNYEEWLKKLEQDKKILPNERRVPGATYFLVGEDDRIIGMCNLRYVLNERLKKIGGHIGYGIRPTERRKGYNKVNLYLALEVYEQMGIERVYIDCNSDNLGSRNTMLALGGIKEFTKVDPEEGEYERYSIDVSDSLKKYKDQYNPNVYTKKR